MKKHRELTLLTYVLQKKKRTHLLYYLDGEFMAVTLKSEKQSVVPFCLVTSEFKEAQILNVGTLNKSKTFSGGLLPMPIRT